MKRIIASVMIAIILSGCGGGSSQQKNNAKTTLYTVTMKKQIRKLYFNGFIQPRNIVNVSSPVDGSVKAKYFRFGQHMKKGEKLLLIDSEKLEADYQEALTSFLKAKEAYTISQGKWRGTEELRKLGFLSNNQFTDELHTREENTLQYYQARQKLTETLRKTNRDVNEVMHYLNQLSMDDIEEVSKALSSDHDSLIMRSPAKGVVLYPEKTSSDSGTSGVDLSTGVLVGTPVKTGDVILAIGDLTGLSVKFKVNEVDILKIKLGQSVVVTGIAFPGLILKGVIENIDTQATVGDNGMPIFNVQVIVPDITDEELQEIHIGMSAKVEVEIETTPVMQIPIAAVTQDVNGNSFVMVQGQDGKRSKVQVETGNTGLTDVVVFHGLNVGDKVVVPETQ